MLMWRACLNAVMSRFYVYVRRMTARWVGR